MTIRIFTVAVLLMAAHATQGSAQSGASAAGANTSPLVIGESFTIPSRVLGETRRINVYVPAGYTAANSTALPVMYMPDGGIAEDFLHVAGILQVSIGNGTMRPFLLVGIENTERRRDMTGPTSVAADRKIAPRVGGSAEFRRFIRTELMPEVRRRYRTTEETAIVGESLAGLFVVETMLVEPGLFNTYIAFDPSLWWDDQRLVKTVGAQLRMRARSPVTLYVSSSSEPSLAPLVSNFADSLRAGAFNGVTWQHVHMPDETHGTIYHPAALRAFRLLFKPAK